MWTPVTCGVCRSARSTASAQATQARSAWKAERAYNVLLERGERRLYRRRRGVAPPKDSTQESPPAMDRPEAALEVHGLGVEHGAYLLCAQVAVGRRQVRLQIAHVIRDLVVRHRCLLRRPTAAPQACQDNVPHLLAGVLYTVLMTGKAREAGLSGSAA